MPRKGLSRAGKPHPKEKPRAFPRVGCSQGRRLGTGHPRVKARSWRVASMHRRKRGRRRALGGLVLGLCWVLADTGEEVGPVGPHWALPSAAGGEPVSRTHGKRGVLLAAPSRPGAVPVPAPASPLGAFPGTLAHPEMTNTAARGRVPLSSRSEVAVRWQPLETSESASSVGPFPTWATKVGQEGRPAPGAGADRRAPGPTP